MLRGIITLAAVAIATPAAAQETPRDDLVVTAHTREMIENFVREISDPAQSGQLARWNGVICSGVIGLAAPHAGFVNARIGEAARIAHLTPDEDGCRRPNILIIVDPQAQALAERIARRFPKTLGNDGRAKLQAFARADGPVRWVARTDLVPYDDSPMTEVQTGQLARPLGKLANSRIEKSTKTIFTQMLIVVDSARIGDVQLGGLADYLAMVALTRPPLGKAPPEQSILTLFERNAAERAGAALTEVDRGYLAGFYSGTGSMSAQAQRSAIRTAMRRSVAE